MGHQFHKIQCRGRAYNTNLLYIGGLYLITTQDLMGVGGGLCRAPLVGKLWQFDIHTLIMRGVQNHKVNLPYSMGGEQSIVNHKSLLKCAPESRTGGHPNCARLWQRHWQ